MEDSVNETSKPKAAVSENVIFDIGYGRADVHAKELVNTSNVQAVNNQRVLIRGKKQDCGYYSNSSLEAYTRCPQQFKRRYIDKEKPRLIPKAKMWGGTAVHDALDTLLTKIKNKETPDEEAFLKDIETHISEQVTDYDQKFAKAKAQKEDPLPLDYGARIVKEEQFPKLYVDAARVFYRTELPKVKPIAVEQMFIHHFEVNTGGTIPIVGFIDLIEEVDGVQYVTDHKVGAARKVEEARTSQQLTLYSFATKIPHTAINNFVLGNTGGKSGKATSKPFSKLVAKKTVKDYERTYDNINQVLTGIKSGAFPRAGIHNPIVCAPNQCPFFTSCMGKPIVNS